MGVDHTATAGFGYKLDTDHLLSNIPDDLDEELLVDIEEEGDWYYLDEIFRCNVEEDSNDKFYIDEIGGGAYTGETNEYYIFIKDSLLKGFEKCQELKDELDQFLKDHNIKVIGEFGLHKGVHIW